MVFHWSLTDSKFHQFSMPILSILADLNNVNVLMVLIRPLISNSIRSIFKLLETIPSIAITITFLFHGWIYSLARSSCQYFRFLRFSFCGPLTRQTPVYGNFSFYLILFHFFFSTITWYGFLNSLKWSIFMSNSQRISCVLFSGTDSSLCIYHLVILYHFNHSLMLLLLLLLL